MLRTLLPLLLLLTFLSACAGPIVGGRCDYEDLPGLVRIVGLPDEPELVFEPLAPGLRQSGEALPGSLRFPLPVPESEFLYENEYPALLAAIIRGSCTPFQLKLLAAEGFSAPLFLPFTSEGQITPAAEVQLQTVATFYRYLEESRSALALELCGRTSAAGSQQYNMSKGWRYVSEVKSRLVELGVPVERFRSTSSGEAPCPWCDTCRVYDEDGVRVRLLLNGYSW